MGEHEHHHGLTAEQMRPVALDLELRRQVLRITWADGVASELPMPLLRKSCPCAACRTEQKENEPVSKAALPILGQGSTEKNRAVGGGMVGNYAIRIDWADGHNTGIYDFRLLRTLAAGAKP